ncbi:MAG: ABC transporter substrate-binding protein [Bryobacteraceae bacterium]
MTRFNWLAQAWHGSNRVTRSLLKFPQSTLFAPFIASIVGLVFLGRLFGIFTGPDSYLIYFVGPLGGDASMVKMENIFRKAAPRSIDGVPIKFEEIDDSGVPAKAQRIASRLAADRRTLMVVGHILSSTTKEALAIYMKADPRIPVILTTETNPEILPASDDPDEEFPVFRLSPTDDDQASSAYAFAIERHARNFWVVQGSGNEVYTEYLANKFLEDAQRNSTKVLLVSSVNNSPSAHTIEQLGVQWVFFAGDWKDGLTLIREVKALHITGIKFILSDGCASQELLNNGGDDVNDVYVMHQLTAEQFNPPKNSHAEDDNHGYGLYATYALAIIDRLLEKADQRFDQIAREDFWFSHMVHTALNIHRVSDARRVLIRCMNRSMGSPFRMSDGKEFRFRKDATRERAQFYTWQIRKHEFTASDTPNPAHAPEQNLARARTPERLLADAQ